jgi:hypothetical protein
VATSRDDSATGTEYTQGYTYGGEGSTDLDVLRNFTAAAWGRVTGASGGPVAHTPVVETEAGRPVDSVRTDSEGYYVMPRTGSCPTAMAVSALGATRDYSCSSTVAERVDLHG